MLPVAMESILTGQDTAGVDDGTTGAVDGTHTAAEALAVVDNGNIINDLDSAGGTHLFTHAAADTADVTNSTCILALVVVGALNNDVVGYFVDVDQILGAVGSALTASDALLFVNFCNTQIVDVDSTELTSDDTLLTADTAIDTLGSGSLAGAAAAVTSDNSGLVGELLLNSHNSSPPYLL